MQGIIQERGAFSPSPSSLLPVSLSGTTAEIPGSWPNWDSAASAEGDSRNDTLEEASGSLSPTNPPAQ